MLLALVNGVGPVNIEKRLGHGGNTVYIFIVEHDDADAQDISNVRQRLILVTLALQFAGQRGLGLDARFHGVDFKASLLYTLLQQVGDDLL